MSFVNVPDGSDFTLANLPFGIISTEADARPRAATAIGDYAVDISVLVAHGSLEGITGFDPKDLLQSTLNDFAALPHSVRNAVRHILHIILSPGSALDKDEALQKKALIPLSQVKMHMPVRVGDYTDFYASKYHAENVGRLFRPGQPPLPPNWLHQPIGYNGRASSIIPSPTPINRPVGQFLIDGKPTVGPSRKLDFELEMGCIVGGCSEGGGRVDVDHAEERIFGLVLLNDWSARDIQRWEGQPLGPFNGKNFATSVSPWVIMPEALESFRTDLPPREVQPQAYLEGNGKNRSWDINLEVQLRTGDGKDAHTICKSNYKHLYFNFAQMIAHHTLSGCALNAGDILGSGTISGPEENACGALLESTKDGSEPLHLPDGITRGYLEDGDEVVLRGFSGQGAARVGFGDCSGMVHPALP